MGWSDGSSVRFQAPVLTAVTADRASRFGTSSENSPGEDGVRDPLRAAGDGSLTVCLPSCPSDSADQSQSHSTCCECPLCCSAWGK